MENKDLPLNGEGKQTRDFTYIDDVVALNILALESDNSASRGK
jgi:nucleoside-diphosphate-sugar epimerase